MVALALFVWRAGPRTPANRLFLLVTGSWAGGLFLTNFGVLPWPAFVILAGATRLLAAVGTVAFAFFFPSRLTRDEWRRLGRLRHLAWVVPAAYLAAALL